MAGKDDLEFVRGTGNVFRDFGHPGADVAGALRAGELAEWRRRRSESSFSRSLRWRFALR